MTRIPSPFPHSRLYHSTAQRPPCPPLYAFPPMSQTPLNCEPVNPRLPSTSGSLKSGLRLRNAKNSQTHPQHFSPAYLTQVVPNSSNVRRESVWSDQATRTKGRHAADRSHLQHHLPLSLAQSTDDNALTSPRSVYRMPRPQIYMSRRHMGCATETFGQHLTL